MLQTSLRNEWPIGQISDRMLNEVSSIIYIRVQIERKNILIIRSMNSHKSNQFRRRQRAQSIEHISYGSSTNGWTWDEQ